MRGLTAESCRHAPPAERRAPEESKSTSARIEHLTNERCPVPFFTFFCLLVVLVLFLVIIAKLPDRDKRPARPPTSKHDPNRRDSGRSAHNLLPYGPSKWPASIALAAGNNQPSSVRSDGKPKSFCPAKERYCEPPTHTAVGSRMLGLHNPWQMRESIS